MLPLRQIAPRLSVSTASVALLSVVLLPCFVPVTVAQEIPTNQADFEHKMTPLFQKYCYSCHGMNGSGGLDLARFKTIEAIQKEPTLWRKVMTRITEKTMPPQGAPQPGDEERSLLSTWIGHTLDSTPESLLPKNPGRVLIHRLSRLEYNNTVRDLFGVTIKPADNFPADAGGGGGFDNNADTLYVPPVLMERYLDAASEVLNATNPKRLIFVTPKPALKHKVGTTDPGGESATVRKLLTYWASRAYRRPAETAEVEGLMQLYGEERKEGLPFEDAIRFTLKAVLVSPNFLFRVERETNTAGARALNDYELASRLSYFLWASMPDDTLFALARAKKLSKPEVWTAQVTRMLKDPKAMALSESFAGQWLRVRDLYTITHPDPGKFPSYTPTLRDAMYQETIQFFNSIVTENGTVLGLLDADYTFLNEELAKHYGIMGVMGPQVRRVALTDGRRGGLLTQASILTLSSYPQRTSPVLRGKWILGNLLGTPPPPPPPVVATLSTDDQPTKEGLTFRQRLEKHRSQPQCAGCHSRLDPLGFALENYDAIGRWRDKIGDVAVDAVGSLPDGTKFSGPIEFKKFLLANRKNEFVHHLSEEMLSYALGRGLESYDMPALRRIENRVASDGYKVQTLIAAVTESYPFRYRISDNHATKVARR
jgi:hypothetical protein